jgi:subtilisin-like proprotein convertase family protein
MKRSTTLSLYVAALVLTLIAFLALGTRIAPGAVSSVVGANSSASKPSTAATSQKGTQATRVEIDIMPAERFKYIDLGSRDNVPVAILSSKDFDASTVDPASINFAGAPTMKGDGGGSGGVENDLKGGSSGAPRLNVSLADVNGDGRQDLVAYFSIPYLSQLSAGFPQATLRARTLSGNLIEGSQYIQTSGESALHTGGAKDASAPNAPAVAFCNAAAITINDNTTATPYPSTIAVAGQTGVISNITVDLLGVSHTFPDDIQILLVGPGGQTLSLMSRAGGGTDIVGVNFTFDDAAAGYLADGTALSGGTFRPSSYGNIASFPAPAPATTTASPYAGTLSTFLGTNPNGTWSLYVQDVAAGDVGTISTGWCLNITTAPSVPPCPATVFQGSLAAGDTTQTGRLVRNGVTSLCTALKASPGLNDSIVGRRFDQYTITNNNTTTQCVTASLVSGCGTTIFLAAYSGSYNPASVTTNYLADNGSSFLNQGSIMGFSMAPGATVVLVVHEITAGAGCASYGLLVEGNICAPAGGCTSITCPANITKSNDPNQCGAVVTYPAPTPNGTCGTINCSPASGSFFAVGTTTVTCTSSAGPTCTFTVTVNDTQPPTITCPANVTAVTDQNCAAAACQTVTFPAPVASDNCPGVTVVCNPPAGSCFPIGVTTVTCTATDASGNTATCSFTISTFDVALQDDSDPSIILLWNSLTGAYRFCCNGITFTGVGKSTIQGCVFTLQHNPADRRVLGRVDKAVHAGTASIQFPPGTTRCTITDRNTLNDTLLPACQ